MLRVVFVLLMVVTLTPSTDLFAQSCEITGTVPKKIRDSICGVAESVHGGTAPTNILTIAMKRAPAAAFSTRSPDAKDMALTLLNAWKTGRGVKVAEVHFYRGRARLAVAETTVFSGDVVKFDD